MPITMKLVEAGFPGAAMLKYSSIQVSTRKDATGSTKPRRARGSGNLRPRPKVFWVRWKKVRRWIHSAKPPKGHIAHQARPTTTIITNTRANQTYQVIAAPKLRPGTAVPKRPTKITVQKMIWFGRISKNWNLRLRKRRATRGLRATSSPGEGSEA